MKYGSVLNNYQIGSYPRRVLSELIVNEVRIDPNHTIVVWELNSKSEIELLNKVTGNHLERLGAKIINFKGSWFHIETGKKVK